jgi:hypothetical protein
MCTDQRAEPAMTEEEFWTLFIVLVGISKFSLLEFQSSIFVGFTYVLSVIFNIDVLCHIIAFIKISFRIWIFSFAFYFDGTMILWILAVRLFMDMDAKPHVCGVLKCLP